MSLEDVRQKVADLKEEEILSSYIEYSTKLEGKIPVDIDIIKWKEDEYSARISFRIEGDRYRVDCPGSDYAWRTTKPHIISMINKLLKVLGYTGEEIKE